MGHVEHFLHHLECGLLGFHPGLRSAVHRLHLCQYLLTVGVVHFRELRCKDGVHLVLLILMGDLYVGERQEAGRKILGGGKGALARVGIEQHLVALRTVVVWQQSFADDPFTEELPHLRF